MGRQPLPPASRVSVFAALGRYVAHPDAPTAMANTVAVMIASNGPFYPAYVWMVAPEAGLPALWTMLASPFFLAIPWLSRRSAVGARRALPLVGIANTVWTAALLGTATGVAVFVYPCLLLAALLWREKPLMLAVLGLGLLAQQVLLRWPWDALSGLPRASGESLRLLNEASVGALLAILVIMLARLLPAGAAREAGVAAGIRARSGAD